MFPYTIAVPLIPEGLLHTIEELKTGGCIDQTTGGQWRPTELQRIPFPGVILPISNADLMRAPAGTYTQYSEYLYTNGHALTVGGQVYDPQAGVTYTVKQALDHNSIHPIKRYVVEAKGRSAAK